MKNLRYLLLSASFLSLMGCSDSDDNNYYMPIAQQDLVVGTWQLTAKSISADPAESLNVPLGECESETTMSFESDQSLYRTVYSGVDCADTDETELSWSKGTGNIYNYADGDDADDMIEHEYSNNNTVMTTHAFDGTNYTTKTFVKVN